CQKQVVHTSKFSGQRFRVRIDEKLSVVESLSASGIERSAHFESIKLSRLQPFDKYMPDELRPRFNPDDVGCVAVFFIEQQQEDIGCFRGLQGKIDSAGLYGCSERIVLSRTRIENFLRA